MLMRWFVLIILFFGFLINFADKSFVGITAAPIMKELGLSYAQWGIIGSSFFWIFPVAAIVVGILVDKFSSKKMISYMLLAWSILQLVGGYVISGFSTILVYRLILGVSEGGYAPASLRLLFSYFPTDMRARVTTIFTAGSTIGAYAVAPLVIFLTQMVGWRHSFAIMGLFSLLLLVLWGVFVPKKSPMLQEIKQQELVTTPKTKITWAEIYPVLLSRACIFTLFASFGFFFLSAWMQIWMPVYFVQVVKVSEMQMANSIFIIGGSSVVLSFIMATISDRIFKKTQNLRIARVSLTGIGMVVGSLFLGSLFVIHSQVWSIIAITMAYGLSYLILSTSHIIMSHQLPERTSTLSGIIVAFQNVAAMISPIVTGFIIQYAGKDNVVQGFNYSFLMISGIILTVGLLFLIFVNPDRKKEKSNIPNMVKVPSSS
ncbi:MFS transporter [Neobacillus rhizophilus]|uniref:MFS transporter n=1 Tax=Neobacillus rhizophilus TaxID=2833579 RepID=A0A942U9S7_9BACI|nr:MFS transporter [Neobacillus rhizophilus]MBS4214144.1 MFS transporter [Neobacillus rhizophilus]